MVVGLVEVVTRFKVQIGITEAARTRLDVKHKEEMKLMSSAHWRKYS